MRGSLRVRRLGAAALLSLCCSPLVAGEIWGYVDAQGVAHFSSEKVDERYELFYRTGVSFDTQQPLAAEPAEALPVAAPTPPAAVPPRLASFFAASPTYRNVQTHLREASKKHGIDYELLKALIVAESGFNAHAVSPKGAVGLMQIMPATAERYGVAGDARAPVEVKLTDPRINIRTGTRYLRYLLNLFPGRLDLALAAYNAGEGAVQRAGNRIPNYRETQNYVKTVMELYTVLKPPAPAVAEIRSQPNRVRMVMGGPPAGGAALRGNMPAMEPPLLQPSRPSQPSQPSTPSGPSLPLGASVPSGPSGPSLPSGPSGPSGPISLSPTAADVAPVQAVALAAIPTEPDDSGH